LTAVSFTNGDTVELERAAHEVTVPDVPGVVASLAPDRRAGWPTQVDLLMLVEDVLLQFLPVVVPALDRLLHERVEVALRGWGRAQANAQQRRQHDRW
jgi:hypothetical protein